MSMEGGNLASKVLKIDGNPRCNLLKKEKATRVSSLNPNPPHGVDTAKKNDATSHTTDSPHKNDSAQTTLSSNVHTADASDSSHAHATNVLFMVIIRHKES
ncbi:hypothetical protein QVD17_24476 [Tagetes erecta]|uniref:Uncharacterized protein n=1 Tax=Tagetes erecta TaxID=13708 RepID=A0AAD8KF73_TARER|nr:hypothetical protein QVD17_24476 [Tagetes erecta]